MQALYPTASLARASYHAVALGCIFLFCSVAQAHPFHICVGQMSWNVESNVWEVSLRMHPQDLERGMKAWRTSSAPQSLSDRELIELQKGCSIEDSDFEKVVLEFLSTQFFIVDLPANTTLADAKRWLQENGEKKDTKSELKWVGKESEKGWLWLHLELSPPSPSAATPERWICNRIFLDLIDRQENSLSIQTGAREKFALQFKKESRILRFQKPTP